VYSGCTVTKVKKIESGNAAGLEQERIIGVTTWNGEEIRFDPPGGSVKGDTIEAHVLEKDYNIAIKDVQRVWIEYQGISTVRTVGLTVGIVAGALIITGAIVVATKQSCPFVYSWNGSRYIFNAEPFGGAIARGLERDDYSELENLQEEDGRYRLLLTNEVDETQHTNFLELWIVDHDPDVRVVSDEAGSLYALKEIQMLNSALDRNGNNLISWLRNTDGKIWEPEAVAGPDGNLKNEIILTFPLKETASRANLIVNAATGLWGSYMIKKMVELKGYETASWLDSLAKDAQMVKEIHYWGEREGTYRLPVEVEEPTGWVVRGAIPHGGPLIAEDRVVPLDVSEVKGEQLRIRLRPPVGFWAMNSFAVSYGSGHPIDIKRVAPVYAQTRDGRNILSDLMSMDDRYYSMPFVTDKAEIVFNAPDKKPDKKRTVFLHSRGWYQLHLRNNSEPDLDTFTEIFSVQDAAVRFAVEQFAEWRRR